jgi:hypothetical protein
LTFNPGETSKTISMTIHNDSVFENGETFVVNLSNPTNASLGDPQGTATILDSTLAVVTVDDVTVLEGDIAEFRLSLGGPASFPITVNWETENQTAVAPGDYVAASGTVTFAPGEVEKTVSITTNIDATSEPAESFVLSLNGAFVAEPTNLGVILDLSTVPALSPGILLLLAAALSGAALIALRRG